MTVLNVVQLLSFVMVLGLVAYAAVGPRDANAAKRRRKTRLFRGYALLGCAVFVAAMAADASGWFRYVLGVAAAGFLVGGLAVSVKNREPSR